MQIETGFLAGGEGGVKGGRQQYSSNLASEVFDKLTPEGLQQSGLSLDTTLEALAEEMRQAADTQQTDRNYIEEQMLDIRAAAKVEENVMKALQNTGQPVTVNHLLAADSLMNVRGSLYEKLIKQQSGKEDRKEKLEKAMESVREGLTSKIGRAHV